MIRSSDTSKPGTHSPWIHIGREDSEFGFITDAQTLDYDVDLKESESEIDRQAGRETEIKREKGKERTRTYNGLKTLDCLLPC